MTDERLVDPNAWSFICIFWLFIVNVFNPEQPKNAEAPIDWVVSGISNDPVKPLQPWNADWPIVWMEEGSVNFVNPLQFWKEVFQL